MSSYYSSIDPNDENEAGITELSGSQWVWYVGRSK